MDLFEIFTSRTEKTILLKKIIQNLHISEEEKDLYILSIEILEHDDFLRFYKKITTQFSTNKTSIEPFSNQLI